MFRLGSLLVGGLIGAGVAMLMSPRNGEDYRRELKNRVNDRYGDVIEQGRIRATELIKTSRDMIDEKLAVGQDYVNTAIEKAKTTIEEVSEKRETAGVTSASTDASKKEESNTTSTTHQQF